MLLGSSGLENHPDGTGNLNAIINGNWTIFNEAFNAANGLTASQSLFVVTASAAVFTADMVGATLRWADKHTAMVTVFTDSTHVTVSTSQTVTSQSFEIYRADVVQTPFTGFARGLLKRLRMLSGDDNAQIKWSNSLNRFVLVPAYESIGYASEISTLNFAGALVGKIDLGTGSLLVNIGTSNLFAGGTKRVIINKGSGGSCSLVFPGGWVFVGTAKPTSIAALNIAILTLTSYGTSDSSVLARYELQA